MKTHMIDESTVFSTLCGDTQTRNDITNDIYQVTCKNCIRTRKFKELKETQKRAQHEEIMNIGKEVKSSWEYCEKCTYFLNGKCLNAYRDGYGLENNCKLFVQEFKEKSCHNCGWCIDLKCTHSNPDVVLHLEDGMRCCFYTKEPQQTFTAKPTDPAIDLLNQVADLIKKADLTTEEKLKVIDFIESRVRQAKL